MNSHQASSHDKATSADRGTLAIKSPDRNIRSALTSEYLGTKETTFTPRKGEPFPWVYLAFSSPVDTGSSLVLTPDSKILIEFVVDPILQGSPLISLPLTRDISKFTKGSNLNLCEGAASAGLTSESTKISGLMDAEIDSSKLPHNVDLVALRDLEKVISRRGKNGTPPHFIDYQIFAALGKLALERSPKLNSLGEFQHNNEPWAINPEAVDQLLDTAAKKHANPSEFKDRFIGIHKDEESNIRYGCRTRGKGAIINVTTAEIDGKAHVVFVEQMRAPVGKSMIEWPAGLIGDNGIAGVLQTADAESREEVGIKIHSAIPLFVSLPNSFAFEPLVFVKVEGKITSAGGGIEGEEDIKRHTIPLNAKAISDFLSEHEKRGAVDPKIYAGLYFLRSYLK